MVMDIAPFLFIAGLWTIISITAIVTLYGDRTKLREELEAVKEDLNNERYTRKGLQKYLDDVQHGKAPPPQPFEGAWGKPDIETFDQLEAVLSHVRIK